jgi:thiol-disulfide isomerase/thioredoxin
MPDRHSTTRRAAAGAAMAIVAALLAGCAGEDDLAAQYREGDQKGYIAGEFQVVEIPAQERRDPVVFEGISERGEPLSSADFAGQVYVVNFWYAACGPCRVEAPLLEEVWQKHQPDDVGFIGINTYDQAPTALSFAEKYGITYPSVITVDGGDAKLAFAAATPLQATPTTLVMDREGRVAARIIGQLSSTSILSALIQDTLNEGNR